MVAVSLGQATFDGVEDNWGLLWQTGLSSGLVSIGNAWTKCWHSGAHSTEKMKTEGTLQLPDSVLLAIS